MQRTIEAAQWVFALALLPYAIAVLMPTWRWLLGCAVLIGGPLAALWIQHWIVAATPGYKERVGDAIGLALFFGISIGFAAGVLVRAGTLTLSAIGWSGARVFALSVAGLAVTVGVVIAPEALREWRLRAPSQACAQSEFQFEVAGARLTLPVSPLFNVYLGRHSRADAYYLWSNEHIRGLCTRTANGARRVRATNIWLHVEHNHSVRQLTCERVPPGWRQVFCALLPSIRQGRMADTDFPLAAHLFAPDEVAMGEFGSTRSTYEDSLTGRAILRRPIFVRSGELTPDGKPLTFACTESGRSYSCGAAYPWLQGAHLDYRFRAAPDAVVEKGLRVDRVTRAAFEALLVGR